MKRQIYSYPKSSFLSLEKDMQILTDLMLKNERLKKLLYYTTPDCLTRPNLTPEETVDLIKNKRMIRMVPKIKIDPNAQNYVVINFDDFIPNDSNPEFRNNLIKIDIICHYDQWELGNFQLRPYRIAAEIDSMLNHKRLTGIGEINFILAKRITLTNEFIGLCMIYEVIHGEEDRLLNDIPGDLNEDRAIGLEENFDAIFNAKED